MCKSEKSEENNNMVRKKVDERIRTLIENCSKTKHRSFFVLVGDHGKDQVANLHYILSKSAVKARPSVLWCYKTELGFSTHKQKRMRQIKKQIQRGLYDSNKEEPFELFVATTNIRWCYYKETQKILGSTYGMCVLQDFEAVTPNIMARTMETVEGGGIVVLLLRTMESLKKLYTMSMDVHARFRTEAHGDVVPRFNERFILSLSSCKNCVVVDDELNVLPISKHVKHIEPIAMGELEVEGKEDGELKELKESLVDTMPVGALVQQAKTMDQAKAVLTFVEAISEKTLKGTVALTAGRGRGKSAALGMSLGAAVAYGYSNIFVTAPSPENLKTVFEFVLKAFDGLKYKEHADYEIIQSSNPEFNRAIIRINIFRDHRQTIQYILPSDSEKLAQAELLAIDEAAAIPLPSVKKLFGPYLIFMSSTINGYEGTGRSLSMKLLDDLRKQQGSAAYAAQQAAALVQGDGNTKRGERKVHEERWEAANNAAHHMLNTGTSHGGRTLREITLETPIRYASEDAVEKWLNKLLCLDADATSHRIVTGTPPPKDCELYFVNRDSLFSYHKLSESFLQRIMALYVSSHYKNQPNDLQLLSDAPAHQVFVLLGPSAEGQGNAGQLPDILCVLQVALEGEISRDSVNAQLRRGQRASGDLIPWTVAQQFQDSEFAGLSGARVVRIATNPDVTGMGYGSRAIDLLTQYYQGNIVSEIVEAPSTDTETPAEKKATTLLKEKVKPRKKLEPLLVPLMERKPERLHWFGTSFGLTKQLYNFWQKRGFSPVYIRQTPNSLTGEHSSILLRSLDCQDLESSPAPGWLADFLLDARRRVVSLLSYEFQKLPVALAMGLLLDTENEVKDTNIVLERSQTGEIAAQELLANITPFDMKRLESYVKNMVDYHMIVDLLPIVTRLYFLQRFPEMHLSYLQRAILLGIGLQHKSVDILESELNLPSNQLLALFNKSVRKFNNQFQSILEKKAEHDMKDGLIEIKKVENAANTMAPTKKSLSEEQKDGQTQALQLLEKQQQQLLDTLDVSKYAIQGSNGEWDAALANKDPSNLVDGNVQLPSKKKSRKKQDEKKESRKKAKTGKKSKYANVN